MTESDFRCGFVAIVGRPNVGKSTLMNHLIGQKVSITSKKAQTTRHKINGVYSNTSAQIIFTDTPGFQTRHRNALNDRLNQNVIESLAAVDLVLLVVEAGRFDAADAAVLKQIPAGRPVLLVVNKLDKIKDQAALARFAAEIEQKHAFIGCEIVSAKHGLRLGELRARIPAHLPPGPPLYPEDMLTDKSSRFLCAEIVREKVFRYLGEELPYAVNVEIESFAEEDHMIRIHAAILVDKDGQKGIIIGKGGERLKKISTEARLDMEKLLDSKVFLRVWVKVKSGWADDVRFLKELGM
ncbi:MAG: GTPase Era [Neisseria sp.]|nr:GTPase Era [Neisseria sp.]